MVESLRVAFIGSIAFFRGGEEGGILILGLGICSFGYRGGIFRVRVHNDFVKVVMVLMNYLHVLAHPEHSLFALIKFINQNSKPA